MDRKILTVYVGERTGPSCNNNNTRDRERAFPPGATKDVHIATRRWHTSRILLAKHSGLVKQQQQQLHGRAEMLPEPFSSASSFFPGWIPIATDDGRPSPEAQGAVAYATRSILRRNSFLSTALEFRPIPPRYHWSLTSLYRCCYWVDYTDVGQKWMSRFLSSRATAECPQCTSLCIVPSGRLRCTIKVFSRVKNKVPRCRRRVKINQFSCASNLPLFIGKL